MSALHAHRRGDTGPLARPLTSTIADTVEAFREKLRADMEYIQRNSWRQEIRILAQTITKLNDSGAH